ncbi:hypothetical protein OG292_20655 [Streptomyces sp. NBC_01511]|uniref:hypothetical protein n=1 Tax=Streptomyces sp. NBC_01511 TaxID=2903889 RepID=UPI0038690671
MIEKKRPKYPIRLKRGASGVPDDGRFHIVVETRITVSTKVESYAHLASEEAIEEYRQAHGHPSAAEILAKESARRDARALRAEGVSFRARRNHGGGPGGRGGA